MSDEKTTGVPIARSALAAAFRACQVAFFSQRAFPDGDDVPAVAADGVFVSEVAGAVG